MEQQEKNGRIYRDWDSVFIDYRESGMTVKAFCEEHGISKGLFYKWRKRLREELRHSCAVALLQAGVDLCVIRDYLGHSSIATTSRYVKTNLKMKRDILEAFWRRAGVSPPAITAWNPTPGLLAFLDSL